MPIRTYTPEERTSFVEILKVVHKRIACYQAVFVCITIKHTKFPNAALLMAEIAHRLEGHYTVYHWLKEKGVFEGIDDTLKYWESHSREYRLRWIDSLIEEFSRPF